MVEFQTRIHNVQIVDLPLVFPSSFGGCVDFFYYFPRLLNTTKKFVKKGQSGALKVLAVHRVGKDVTTRVVRSVTLHYFIILERLVHYLIMCYTYIYNVYYIQ